MENNVRTIEKMYTLHTEVISKVVKKARIIFADDVMNLRMFHSK